MRVIIITYSVTVVSITSSDYDLKSLMELFLLIFLKVSGDANWRIPKREQDAASHMTCHLRPSISIEMESG